jgi:hypothetical protein
MTDMHVMAFSPREEFRIVALTWKIGACAIGKVRLRCPVHRMIAGIVPGGRYHPSMTAM